MKEKAKKKPTPKRSTAHLFTVASGVPRSRHSPVLKPIFAVAVFAIGSSLGCDGSDQPIPLPPPAEGGPCDGTDSDAVTRICIYANESDLRFLADNSLERVEVAASVRIDGEDFTGAEIEVHGGFARTVPKLSYRLKFPIAPEAIVDLFGDGEAPVKRVVLQASWIDRSFSRAKIAMDLTRGEGGLAPRVGHVQVFLNDEWHGLYLAIERVDAHFLRAQGLDPDQLLFKAESHGASWAARSSDPLNGFDVVRGGDLMPEENLLEAFSALHAAPTTDADYDRLVAPRLHLGDWVAWHIAMTYAANTDTFTKNYYLHLNTAAEPGTLESRMRVIQWDADGTLGNNWDGAPLPANDPDLARWYGETNAFAARYFSVQGYRADYLQQYSDALQTRLLPAEMIRRVDTWSEAIRPFAERDLARWQPDFAYEAEQERLRLFLQERHGVVERLLGEQTP